MSDVRQSSDARHAWFRARIALHVAGLLTEEEEREFSAHASGCRECGELLAAYRQDDEPGALAGGHIPAGVLAAWPRASQHLAGLERELIRRHLASCESCRAELEALGHRVEWGPVGLPPPSEGALRSGDFALGAPPTRSTGGIRTAAWSGWLAAASLAVVLAIRSRAVPPREESPPMHAPLEGRAAPRLTSGPASEPVQLESPRRGSQSAVPRIRIGSETRFIALGIPPLEIPDSARSEISCVDAEGRTIARLEMLNAGLFRHRIVALASDDGVWKPGRYSVHVSGLPGRHSALTTAETARYEFELVTDPGLSP